MGSEPNPKQLKQYLKIVSQNTRGFSVDKEEECIDLLKTRKVFAACLLETWRIGKNLWENDGLAFIQDGLVEKPCARGLKEWPSSLGLRHEKLGRKPDVHDLISPRAS